MIKLCFKQKLSAQSLLPDSKKEGTWTTSVSSCSSIEVGMYNRNNYLLFLSFIFLFTNNTFHHVLLSWVKSANGHKIIILLSHLPTSDQWPGAPHSFFKHFCQTLVLTLSMRSLDFPLQPPWKSQFTGQKQVLTYMYSTRERRETFFSLVKQLSTIALNHWDD